MITITLNEIKSYEPCRDGWKKVLKAHEHLGMDTPFPLAAVVESNGIDDAVWCLCGMQGKGNILLQYVAWCCYQVKHIINNDDVMRAIDIVTGDNESTHTDDELDEANKLLSEYYGPFWGTINSLSSHGHRYLYCGYAEFASSYATHNSINEDLEYYDAYLGAVINFMKKKLIQILNAGHWVE